MGALKADLRQGAAISESIYANGLGSPSRLYEKSMGIMVPMMLQIQQAGDQLHLEAWVRATRLTQVFALFLNPAEVGIESGGDIHYRIPRWIARKDVNKLLNSLGRPPIA